MQRFAGYWGATPALERIVFDVVVDARQRLIELESGSVDLATSILPEERRSSSSTPISCCTARSRNDVSYLAFNTQHPPFDDPRVRRAANFAINKEPIVKLAYQGHAIAADGPLPPHAVGLPRARDALRLRPGDGAAAARRGRDGRDVRSGPDLQALRAVDAAAVPAVIPSASRGFSRARSSRSGSTPSSCSQPYPEHRAALERGEHDLCVFGWVGDTGDPDNFLYVLFSTRQHRAGRRPRTSRSTASPRSTSSCADAQAATDEHDAHRALRRGPGSDRGRRAVGADRALASSIVAGRAELEHVVISPTGHPIFALIRRAELDR